MARIDHWFKNAFMLLGVLLAFFYQPALLGWPAVGRLGLAVLATCLVASSNYVLNELLDGPRDRLHPLKRHRPVPSGRVTPALAYLEWGLLAAAAFACAARINAPFLAAAMALWVAGVLYNVPPVRTKEWPYLDVLSESFNNPLRLLLGWFALISDRVPPVSLMIAYWMAGAFFMATKRLAEYRHLGPVDAARYRQSFAYYNQERLLVSMLFYATACALFAGIFIVRYHIELILVTPLTAGLFAYYMKLGLQPDSPAQSPEHLYRQKGFVAYLAVCAIAFVVLMFTSIPVMYDIFNVESAKTDPLWKVSGERTR
jgi:4-hydroxybenzoate polyprenyltransferase